MLDTLKNILLLVLALSSIAVVHEFGHFITAKAFGVYCGEFSIGMGPEIFSHQFKETKFSLRAFLIGGYVSMAGETENQEDDGSIPENRRLCNIHPVKRIIVMLAGIFMNFIYAIVIVSIILLNSGYYGVSGNPVVKETSVDYPAYDVLQAGDYIKKVEFENGSSLNVSDYSEMSAFLETYDGNGPWTITVDRNGETLKFDITPQYVEEENRYLMGATFDSYTYEKVTIFNCWGFAFDYLMMIFKLTINALFDLFRGIGLDNLSGPVGMYSAVSEVREVGFEYYFILIAMLSLNVGIMNALPLPVLDGGRVVLTLIEVIIGHPVNKKIETILMSVSIALIFLLFLVVTYRDILKLF